MLLHEVGHLLADARVYVTSARVAGRHLLTQATAYAHAAGATHVETHETDPHGDALATSDVLLVACLSGPPCEALAMDLEAAELLGIPVGTYEDEDAQSAV